jgi:outer membrane protein TolC
MKTISALMTAFITIITALVPGSAPAEEAFTLQSVVGMALQNNKKYMVTIEKTNETRNKVLESWGALWPQLQSDVAYSQQKFQTGVTSPYKGETRFSIVDGTISVNPGIFYNTLQATRNAHIVAEYSARQTKAEIVLQAVNYFYQLILSEDKVELEKLSVQALQENHRIITLGEQRGTFTKFDFLQSKVSYNNERTTLINLENALATDRANLNMYIGRSMYSKVRVDRKMLNDAVAEISRYILDEKAEEKLVDNFIGRALKNRPEVFQFKHNRQMEIHTAQASESYYLWPTFSVNGNFGYNMAEREPTSILNTNTLSSSNYNNSMVNNYNTNKQYATHYQDFFEKKHQFWSVSLGATYRWGALSPVDANHAKANQARSRARQQELGLEDFVQSVGLEVQKAYLQLKSASISLSWQKGNVKTAEDLYITAVQQFKRGTIDYIKLLNANTSLTTAKSLYVQALHDSQQAKAMLNKAIGEDYFVF